MWQHFEAYIAAQCRQYDVAISPVNDQYNIIPSLCRVQPAADILYINFDLSFMDFQAPVCELVTPVGVISQGQ